MKLNKRSAPEPTKKLGDVSQVTYGYTEKTRLEEVGPKFLRITDIQDGNVDWNSVPYCQISNDELPKYLLRNDDIVFARTGATTGKSFLVKNPPLSVFASYLIRLRILDFKVLMPEFLYLFFQTKTYWDKIQIGVSGSAQGGFNASKLSELKINLPPIDEQKRIVGILDEVFEGVAKAKENVEGNLRNVSEVFEAYLQAVDPRKESLGKLVNITTGKLDANAAVEDGKYPFFTCSRQIFAIDKFAFDCEAILLAGNNAVGDFNVKHYQGKFNAYQRTYVITVNEENRVIYRYLYFQLVNSLKEFKSKSVGAGTKFLKLGMIKDLQISLPSVSQQKEIVSKLDALSTETKKLEAIYKTKLNHLEELKKSILKKAFNGEL